MAAQRSETQLDMAAGGGDGGMAFGSASPDQLLEEATPLLPCLAVYLQTLQPRLQAAMQHRREATELAERAVAIAAAMAPEPPDGIRA